MRVKHVCKKSRIAKNFGFSSSKQQGSSASSAFSPELLKQAPGLLNRIQQFPSRIASGGVEIPDDDALFGQIAERGFQTLRPGMAGRGLLTSGAGQEAEDRFISDLSTQFGERSFERSLQAGQFEREGQVQGSAVLLDALRAILGQGTTSISSSSGSSFGLSGGKGE